MKEGWKAKKLIDVCSEITDGSHFSPKNFDRGSFPYITVRDLESDLIDFTNCKFIGEEDYNSLVKNGCRPLKGDLLFSKDGTVGKVSLIDVDKEFVVLSSLAIIRPKHDTIDSTFLKYALKNPDFLRTAIGKKTGVAIRRIILKNLKQIEICYPTRLSSQKSIVAILDRCFEAIDKAKANVERNLQNAKELFQSQLNQIFNKNGDGCVEKKLGDVCEYVKKRNENTDLPYVGLEHIESNSGKFIGTLNAHLVKSSTFHFNSKHILYGRLRPYLNKVLMPNFEGHCSTEIFPILVNESILREYLFYWFISGNTVKQIDATWTGTRMPRANMNQILQFTLPFPSIDVQQSIVDQLEELKAHTQSLEFNYRQELDALDELKKSILQKAFNGELTKTEEAAA